MSRSTLYALRDQSGMSRLEFYVQYFPESPGEEGQVDVPGSANEPP